MAKTKNQYSYPVSLKEIPRISYDESPAHVGTLKHSVDFIVPEGTPILAAEDGVVVEVKTDSDIGGENKELESFGNYIELRHAHDEYSEYEHLRKDGAVAKVGDKVRRGQIIGYSGATGWLAHLGPHLHFMVGKYSQDGTYETREIVWNENRQGIAPTQSLAQH